MPQILNPDYLYYPLPVSFDFAHPDRDPDTVWPAPHPPMVYQDQSNPESSLIPDWRYVTAKQVWADGHKFVSPLKPWVKATAPQWQVDWVNGMGEPSTFDQAPKPAGWRKVGNTTDGGDWIFEEPALDPFTVALDNLKQAIAGLQAVWPK